LDQGCPIVRQIAPVSNGETKGMREGETKPAPQDARRVVPTKPFRGLEPDEAVAQIITGADAQMHAASYSSGD
jgi:hypothetical protein